MLIPDKVLHNETQRHIARLAVRTNARIQALDTLVRSLHAEGVWDRLHTLNIAVGSSADTLLDLKGNQDSVLVGAPAFSPDRGFTTVSTTDYINTQVAPSAADYNNIGLSCYIRAVQSGSGFLMGERDLGSFSVAYYVSLRGNTTTTLFGPIQAAGSGAGVAVSGGGFRGASRLDASNIVLCGDETTVSVVQASYIDIFRREIFVGCNNSSVGAVSPSPNQFAHWSITKGLTPTEWLVYDNLIKDYFTTAGTAV